jgi:ELWxxDGT repeat protein
LTNVNGTLFFVADDGHTGAELWTSNGAAAGTKLVKDIHPGSVAANIGSLTAVGSTLFFAANNGVSGIELWKSNGAGAGTVLVKDINPDNLGMMPSSYPNNLTNVNGTLFFTANNGVSGTELWTSNGAAPGTVLVRDINPGAAGSDVSYLTNAGGTLFFRADDGTHGTEVWELTGIPRAGASRLNSLAALAAAPIRPFAAGSSSNATAVANPASPVYTDLGTASKASLPRPSDLARPIVNAVFRRTNYAGSATLSVPNSVVFASGPTNVTASNLASGSTGDGATIGWGAPVTNANKVAKYEILVTQPGGPGTFTTTYTVSGTARNLKLTGLDRFSYITVEVVAVDANGDLGMPTFITFVST